MSESLVGLAIAEGVSSLRYIALLFNVAANPKRLLVIRSLAAGSKRSSQLCEEMGIGKKTVTQLLDPLLSAKLVNCKQACEERSYELTEPGRELSRAAEAISKWKADDSLQAGSVERLHGLLKLFADPVRLRLLSLLSGMQEICVCHLHEALDLPQSTVSRHLAQLRDGGIIVGRREGTWVYYRLTRPASTLGEVLFHYLGPGCDRCDEFEADRRRLKGLLPCAAK